MSYFALLIAVVLETFLPDGFFLRTRGWVNRFNQELEINLEELGAPSYSHLQWLAPLVVWILCIFFVDQVLLLISPWLSVLLCIFFLVCGLRFRHFSQVFTNTQLFLNQGDFFRARELLLLWIKEFDGSEPVIHRPGELVFHAIYHGTERVLRQYFSLIFWFLLVPGPYGVVVYMLVHWSVVRERQMWLAQAFSHEFPSMQESWESGKWRAVFSPRFALFAMEWLPARLLALTVGMVSQMDNAALAWRIALSQSRFSNRAPLTAVFFSAVGLSGPGVLQGPLMTEETQVQALQQFRQLVFKCAMVWLFMAFLLALAGWLPDTA